MDLSDIESRLKLCEGDTLKRKGHHTKGPLDETDIFTYDVVNSAGDLIGTVEHQEHTAIKGFTVTHTLCRYDMDGNVLIDERWKDT